MVRGNLVAGAVALASALIPAPPGTIVQDVTAVHGGYHAVVSRERVGGPGEDQWYFSVYARAKSASAMIYRSPSAADPFAIVPKLEQGNGTKMYFPRETVKLSGMGELMGEPRDQTLVLVHAASADCGGATLSIISVDANAMHTDVQVSNPCDLAARVDHHRVILTGPYYNATAPLYKPTKNKATAVLRYTDGRWVETPHYFKLSVPRQAAATPLTSPSPMFTPIFKSVVSTPHPTGPPVQH